MKKLSHTFISLYLKLLETQELEGFNGFLGDYAFKDWPMGNSEFCSVPLRSLSLPKLRMRSPGKLSAEGTQNLL